MSERQSFFDQETKTRNHRLTVEVEASRTPDEVLNRLHDIISEKQPIRVHGANRFAVKVGDWRRIELGKNVFVRRDVPRDAAGGTGRVCRKRTPDRAHDRKDVPCALHVDGAFETA